MTHQEFIDKVAQMRTLQKEYFRDRNRSTLDQCKFVEREVDRALEDLTAPVKQHTLFKKKLRSSRVFIIYRRSHRE